MAGCAASNAAIMSTRFCRRLGIAPGVALLVFSAVWGSAATIPPAPILEKPLAPVVSETPGEAPSPQHVWVPAHWRWLEGAYVWEAGRWEIPPAAGVVWHAPEWKKEANGFVLIEGFWDEAPAAAPAAAQPTTVVRAAPTPPPQEIVVTAPPPPPQREIILERPSPTHVWVSGYWAWRAGRHVWVGGHWATPPRTGVVWVGPRWETRGGRHVFVDGYWRDVVVVAPPAVPPQVVVSGSPVPGVEVSVVLAPPPPRREVPYARPGPDYVWINGYWAWRGGRHVWIAGYYARPPRGHRVWIEPRWERRGGNYIFIEGRWGN